MAPIGPLGGPGGPFERSTIFNKNFTFSRFVFVVISEANLLAAESQLLLIGNTLTNYCYVLGDFNLDVRMEMRPDDDHKVPLYSLTILLSKTI